MADAPRRKIKNGRSLIDNTILLDTQIEYAAAESAIFRLQANNARSMLAHIFGLISARRALDFQLAPPRLAGP